MIGRNDMDERLLNADEVAEILNISRSLVYKLIRRGDLRAVRIASVVRIRHEDLKVYVQKKALLNGKGIKWKKPGHSITLKNS